MLKYWWEEYRNAASDTLEGKLWLTAGCIVCSIDKLAEHEEICRRVAKLAFENNWCIWHALWVANEKKGLCYCADCCKTLSKD
jgi:hypothetical protein